MAASTSQMGEEQGGWLGQAGSGVALWPQQDGENEKKKKSNK